MPASNGAPLPSAARGRSGWPTRPGLPCPRGLIGASTGRESESGSMASPLVLKKYGVDPLTHAGLHRCAVRLCADAHAGDVAGPSVVGDPRRCHDNSCTPLVLINAGGAWDRWSGVMRPPSKTRGLAALQASLQPRKWFAASERQTSWPTAPGGRARIHASRACIGHTPHGIPQRPAWCSTAETCPDRLP